MTNEKTPSKGQRLGSRQEAAAIAGVHVRTVDYWRRNDRLTTYRERGFHVKIDLDELEAFLAATREPDQRNSA